MVTRYTFIRRKVLELYRKAKIISYPIDPLVFLALVENCKVMPYHKFAKLNNCSLEHIIEMCDSRTGCTHYDINSGRYLVLYNTSCHYGNNVEGRIRWTLAHELGHIVLNHFSFVADSKIAEFNLNNICNSDLEREADFFASTFLCPFPIWKIVGVSTVEGVRQTFGLSEEASGYRVEQYKRWLAGRTKTAWDNKPRH